MDHADQASPYYNRIKGFGPRHIGELDKLLAEYGSASPSFELTPEGMTEAVARSLNERGYMPRQQLVYLYAELGDDDDEQSAFEIECVTDETAETFIGWIGESHGSMIITQEMMVRSKGYFHRPDFAKYMLRIGGSPASMGSMFVHDNSGIWRMTLRSRLIVEEAANTPSSAAVLPMRESSAWTSWRWTSSSGRSAMAICLKLVSRRHT